MPPRLFMDPQRGAIRLDELLREDPAAARALSERDVSKLMRGKPTTIRTLADGTRNLVWQGRGRTVGIFFTGDHRFDRIYLWSGY